MNILYASHLKKRYNKRYVVNDVSISIRDNEIVGLLGPNGAGKTTSFYMMVGLVKACSGSIKLNEHDITHKPIHERSQLGIGYLPQEPSVFRKLSVEDNIMSVLELRSIRRSERKDKLEQLINDFNFSHIRTNPGLSLSGGERRRVEIARALAMEPMFILLDEPFAGIDPISVNEIKGIIKKLSEKGVGILITDHNVRETLDICERAYIVKDGEVFCEGTPEQIMQNEKVRQFYLGEEFTI